MEAGRCDGGSLKWGQRGASARVGRVKREGSRTSLRCTAVVVVRLQGCGERRTAWKWATGASRSGSWKGFGRGSWRASVPPGSFTHSVAQGFLSQRRSPIPIAPELTLLPPRAGVNYSFSVSAKSSNFNRTKQTRTYMIGTDLNRSSTSSPLSPLPPPCALPPNAPPPPPPPTPITEYSVHALDWVLSHLADDNDELVVLRVIDPVEKTKPRMAEAREEAEAVLERIMKTNGEDLQLSIIVEFAIGPIEETIHRCVFRGRVEEGGEG